MRSVNQAAAAAETHGTEPIVLAVIDWGLGGGTTYYADRNIGLWDGRILDFSGVTSQQNSEERGMVSSCRLVLSDHDGVLKYMIDFARVEGRWVRLYEYFNNASGNETEIFRGQISGPVEWDEATRQLSFEVVSAIESQELGYTIETDQFDSVNDIGVGKSFPMVFGSAAHVPSPLIQTSPRSELKKPIYMAGTALEGEFSKVQDKLYKEIVAGGKDPVSVEMLAKKHLETLVSTPIAEGSTNIPVLDRIYLEDVSQFDEDVWMSLEIDGVIFRGIFNADVDGVISFSVIEANTAKWEDIQCDARSLKDKDYLNPKVCWLKRSDIDLVNHFTRTAYSKKVVVPGPDPDKVVTRYYQNPCIRQEGRKCWFKYPFFIKKMPGAKAHPRHPEWGLPQVGVKFSSAALLNQFGCPVGVEITELVEEVEEKLKARKMSVKASRKGDDSAITPLLRQLDLVEFLKNAFWSASEGTTVRQWNPDVGDMYVPNMFESDSIKAVYGVRTKGDQQVFTSIPSSYYTVHLAKATNAGSEGPSTVTAIEFTRPLDSYTFQYWEWDTIYVSVDSIISDNTATQIEYIIDNYTDFSADSSFATVISQINGYPSRFAYFQTVDALQMCQDMAYQARCGLITDGSSVKIRYLSAEPSTVFTLTETKTEFHTLKISHTLIDDILTLLRAKWRRTYAPEFKEKDRYITWRNNTDEFGLRKKEIDFFIYNDAAFIEKSLTFWGNRYCRSWKLLSLATFPEAYALEVFDAVELSYSTGILGFIADKAVCERVEHNVLDAEIKLQLWVPVEAGDQDTHAYAWLSDGALTYTDPTVGMEVTDVAVTWSTTALDTAELMRELRKLEDSTSRLAKVTIIDPKNPARVEVDFYDDGPFEPSKSSGLTHDINPTENLKVGDWVWIKGGQDGVHYAERTKFDKMLGIVVAKDDTYAGTYTVRLIHTADRPTSELPEEQGEDDENIPLPSFAYDWDIDTVDDWVNDTVEEPTEISVVNIAELHLKPNQTGLIEPGSIVNLMHMANMTDYTEDAYLSQEDWWFFDRSTTTPYWAEVLDYWTDADNLANILFVSPCDSEGVGTDPNTVICCYIHTPRTTAAPEAVPIVKGDIVAYHPIVVDDSIYRGDTSVDAYGLLIDTETMHGTFSSPYSMLPSTITGSNETAQTDTWSRADPPEGTDGVKLRDQIRTVYNHAGDKILYEICRVITWDSTGRLAHIDIEVRYSVDPTGLCT